MPADWEGRSPLDVCKELLAEFRIPEDMYQVGRTKLFFRAGVLGHLEDTSARINRCAAAVCRGPLTEGDTRVAPPRARLLALIMSKFLDQCAL